MDAAIAALNYKDDTALCRKMLSNRQKSTLDDVRQTEQNADPRDTK